MIAPSSNFFIRKHGSLAFLLSVLFLGTFALGVLAQETSKNAPTSATNEGDSELTDADSKYVPKTKSQLKRSLTAMQYKVTQEEGTEPAYSNKFWNNKKEGTYTCIICNLPLFDSKTKFESGTGWPSFYAPINQQHLGTKVDRKMAYPRTEVHCQRCGAHLGHVFNDGPQPTGLRFCMNSASLTFREKDKDKAVEKSK